MRQLAGVLVAVVATLVAMPASAQVGVSPVFIDVPLEQAQRTQAFRLHNFTDETKHVRVRVAPWRMDDAGEAIEIAPSAESIDQWAIVNPAEFSVDANESKAIRFSVRPAIALSPGEHRLLFVFDEVPTPRQEGDGAVRVFFQLRSAVYVQVGEPKRTANIATVKADTLAASVTLEATGTANTRLDGQAVLWPEKAFPGVAATGILQNLGKNDFRLPDGAVAAVALPEAPVLPGMKRTYEIPWPAAVPAGRYVLDLNGNLGDETLDRSFALDVRAP